jgi:rhodanese-related sulfurtransferase
MALIRSDALFATLRAQQHMPYTHFPERRRAALGDVLRVFNLRAGDGLSLVTNDQQVYISVLDGIVGVEACDGGRTEIRRGETRLLAPPGEILRASTIGGAVVCVADSESIDELMSFESLIDGAKNTDKLSMEALERARRSPAFRRVPLECVEEALCRMNRMHVVAGTDVIHQGDQGELFYVITQGKAEVWQTGLHDDAPQRVAELGPGDSFGDEALVTGGTRSATVRITADAELLTLGKTDYQSLIAQQMVDEADPAVAQTMLKSGYRLLDVRYPEEFEDACISSAMLIPLPDLRSRADELDRSTRWVVYCRSGKRSAVASLLLKQRGIQAVSLRGGINSWPYGVVSGLTAEA